MSANLMENKYFVVLIKKGFFPEFTSKQIAPRSMAPGLIQICIIQ